MLPICSKFNRFILTFYTDPENSVQIRQLTELSC